MGGNNVRKGYVFLPVKLHGHATMLMIDLNCMACDVQLSTAALTRVGTTPPATDATTLDTLTIGTDVQRHVPISVISQPDWTIHGPENTVPVIGTVGVHFLTTHYDMLYDFPGRRVRLYALPAKAPVASKNAWLPEGFKPTDCGPMVDVSPGAATFTGVKMRINDHPVTGVLEMGPYYPKMNERALQALGAPANVPSIHLTVPTPIYGDHVLIARVDKVEMTIRTHIFGAWNSEVLRELDVQQLLPPNTPIMLIDLSMLRNVMLFNAVSSRQVCVAAPQG